MTARGAFAIRDALRAGRRGVEEDLRVQGEVMLRDLRSALSTPFPPPSRPGEDPHLRTGELRRSYSTDVDSHATSAVLEIASRIKYSVFLEFGTRYMLARPHLRPLAVRHIPGLRERVGGGIERRERRSR